MEICLTCRISVDKNTSLSIHNFIDGIKVKDILYDLNYKVYLPTLLIFK